MHICLCSSQMIGWLVVWNIFYFSIIYGNVIIPTDELIFFRGVGIPPTRSLSPFIPSFVVEFWPGLLRELLPMVLAILAALLAARYLLTGGSSKCEAGWRTQLRYWTIKQCKGCTQNFWRYIYIYIHTLIYVRMHVVGMYIYIYTHVFF